MANDQEPYEKGDLSARWLSFNNNSRDHALTNAAEFREMISVARPRT